MDTVRPACSARSAVVGLVTVCVPLLGALLGAGCDRPAAGQEGALGNRNGQKSVTPWNRLELAP